MNDPHVQTLRFKLRSDESTSYKEDAPSVDYETNAFKGTLEKGMLVMTMKEHFATTGEAIRRVLPDLRTWEVFTGVEHGPGNLRFEFDGDEVIDRAPSPPGRQVHLSAALSGLSIFGSADLHVVKGQYPTPPTQFIADPIVEVLWKRYVRYRKGGEPITGMAYFCLTVIEADAISRKQAAAKFAIHPYVLSKLGELTSQVGDESEARKGKSGATFTPISDNQRAWIDAAVRKLILRAGEYAANPTGTHTQITMADLPAL